MMDDVCFMGDTVTSDHMPLLLRTKLRKPIPTRPETKTFRDYKRTDIQLFQAQINEKINETQFPPLNSTENINSTVTAIENIILEASEASTPLSTININKQTLPKNIIEKIKSKRKLYRQYINSRDPALKTEWNRQNAQIRLLIKQHREIKWIETTLGLDYRNGSEFWHTLKKLPGKYKKTYSHLKINDDIITENLDKANAFKNQLSETYRIPTHDSFNEQFFEQTQREIWNFARAHPGQIPTNPNCPLRTPISEFDIEVAIHRGKNTAPGPDSINRQTMKRLPNTIYPILAHLMNSCLEFAYFPRSWKCANTVMIPKPGKDPTKLDSYRPISLINVPGKIFELILKLRIMEHFEINDILPPFQHGFRPEHSTQNALIGLTTDVEKSLNSGHCTVAIFLDIQKAFDKVWHAGLIKKLIEINLPEHFIRLLVSYIGNRRIRVKIGTELSDPPITPQAAQNTQILNRRAQNMLDEFTNWCSMWRVQLNPNKAQTILFKHPNNSQKPSQKSDEINLTLLGERLELQDEVCYLGVTLTRTLNWQTDLDKTLTKARMLSWRPTWGESGSRNPNIVLETENDSFVNEFHGFTGNENIDSQNQGPEPGKIRSYGSFDAVERSTPVAKNIDKMNNNQVQETYSLSKDGTYDINYCSGNQQPNSSRRISEIFGHKNWQMLSETPGEFSQNNTTITLEGPDKNSRNQWRPSNEVRGTEYFQDRRVTFAGVDDTDEDSGEEDNGGLVDNLTFRQLRANAEIRLPNNDRVGVEWSDSDECDSPAEPMDDEPVAHLLFGIFLIHPFQSLMSQRSG
ncbi:hypothetical protein JTB14_021252 [Gonioctena quinquepunctata]|nr:hypothetical protein JTB14_021252 [Gonioctena quinquepunctata]